MNNSRVLTEATTDSLQDLFSRNLFNYVGQEFSTVISIMRQHRQSLDAATANNVRPRNTRVHAAPLNINPEDLGI